MTCGEYVNNDDEEDDEDNYDDDGVWGHLSRNSHKSKKDFAECWHKSM